MALPPQAIDRMVQQPTATQGIYKELLLLASALLVLMLVLFVGLKYGYQAYLRNSVATLDKNIKAFGDQIPQADQDRTAQFYSALVNLRELLKSHTVASPAFALLERTVSPNIYYSKMNINTTTNEVDLTGAARGIGDAASEAALLEKQPEVDRVNLTNIGNQNGLWQFTMNVFLKPEILHANGSGSISPVPAPAAFSTSSAVLPPPAFNSSSSASSTPNL